jgi:hypothetical protein
MTASSSIIGRSTARTIESRGRCAAEGYQAVGLDPWPRHGPSVSREHQSQGSPNARRVSWSSRELFSTRVSFRRAVARPTSRSCAGTVAPIRSASLRSQHVTMFAPHPQYVRTQRDFPIASDEATRALRRSHAAVSSDFLSSGTTRQRVTGRAATCVRFDVQLAKIREQRCCPPLSREFPRA